MNESKAKQSKAKQSKAKQSKAGDMIVSKSSQDCILLQARLG
jgi:hypothetical protein